jgi:hypothetical protein
MNINLTDIEINMILAALDCVWWDEKPTAERGKAEAHRVTQIRRKLAKAMLHAETIFE